MGNCGQREGFVAEARIFNRGGRGKTGFFGDFQMEKGRKRWRSGLKRAEEDFRDGKLVFEIGLALWGELLDKGRVMEI
jgi:hypothetical protein